MITARKLRNLLNTIPDPVSPDLSLVTAGRVLEARAQKGRANIVLEIPKSHAEAYAPLSQELKTKAEALWGIKTAQVILTATGSGRPAPEAEPSAAPKSASPKPDTLKPTGVKRILAVTSTKGGVGKSTLAVLLAKALKAQGLAVGVLDADIYGPSLPRLLNLSGPIEVDDNKRIQPRVADGLKALSIGFLVDPEKAAVWRGPMVSGAIQQFMQDADWGELDVLVIDMPPGTGDAHITVAQKAGVDGALVITTPHQLSVDDTRRGLQLFERLNVPVLGLVENMAHYQTPDGDIHHIFGQGGAQALAQAVDLPILTSLPIDPQLNEHHQGLQDLAQQVMDGLELKASELA